MAWVKRAAGTVATATTAAGSGRVRRIYLTGGFPEVCSPGASSNHCQHCRRHRCYPHRGFPPAAAPRIGLVKELPPRLGLQPTCPFEERRKRKQRARRFGVVLVDVGRDHKKRPRRRRRRRSHKWASTGDVEQPFY